MPHTLLQVSSQPQPHPTNKQASTMKTNSRDIVRRSSRRVKKCSYDAGDVVELEYDGIITTGRLVSRSSDENAANPRWRVIVMDGDNERDDKLLNESCFGDVVGKTSSPGDTKTNRKNRKESPSNAAGEKVSEARLVTNSSEESNRKNDSSSKRKAESNVSDSSMTPSDMSKAAARASAREERVRRRQANVEVKLATANMANLKKQKKFHHNSSECIKIPMLTGTLYLYHGLTRRAEFVRKV